MFLRNKEKIPTVENQAIKVRNPKKVLNKIMRSILRFYLQALAALSPIIKILFEKVMKLFSGLTRAICSTNTPRPTLLIMSAIIIGLL